jgi:hypothetical protein
MRNLVIIGVVFASFAATNEAFGQFSQQQRAAGFSAFSQNRSGFRSAATQILSRSTTSPYLALTDLTGQGLDTSRNYFTQVRPALERQQQQQLQQRQIQQIQQNVSQIRSDAARRTQTGPQGTGHPTRFNAYFQYYPGFARRR